MKKLIFVLTILVLALTAVSVSANSAISGGPFSTAFRVANLSASPANCVATMYDASGNTAHTINLSNIPVGDSALVFTPNETNLPSGQYSSVVSCDQEVSAVVNFSDADSGASHNGVSGTALTSTVYNPTVYKNYFNFLSETVVQNATNGTIDVTVEIFQSGNPTPVSTQTQTNVPAFASISFDHSSDANLSNSIAYSAKVTATGNIASIVNIWGQGPVAAQLYSYNSFAAGSTNRVFTPVIMNNYFGYNTALTVQNIDPNTAASVTVTYGTGQTANYTIQPNSAEVIYTPSTAVPLGTLTGATITSNNNVEIVAIVNESNNYNRAASYAGFNSGSTSVSVPIAMDKYFNYNSSITCQNVGAATANINIAYSNGVTDSVQGVAALGSALFYQPTTAGIPDGTIFSATVTSAEPIVCVVNQDQNEGAQAVTSMDQLFAYEGIGD